MNKENMVHIYTMEYYSVVKKEWDNAIGSNMDGPRDCHTKWNKPDGERRISYDIPYMSNLKKMIHINLYTKQKWTHRHRKQIYGDFPDGPAVKNPPANAEDTGLIPSVGRSHMPQSTKPVGQHSWALGPLCSHSSEKPTHRRTSSPCPLQLEKTLVQR